MTPVMRCHHREVKLLDDHTITLLSQAVKVSDNLKSQLWLTALNFRDGSTQNSSQVLKENMSKAESRKKQESFKYLPLQAYIVSSVNQSDIYQPSLGNVKLSFHPGEFFQPSFMLSQAIINKVYQTNLPQANSTSNSLRTNGIRT